MLKMGVRSVDGYVYFNELLYRCMRRLYGSFRLNKQMYIIELKTQYKIYNMTLKQLQASRKEIIYESFFKKMIGAGKSVNPFLLQMYFHISFNTWLNHTRREAKRERHCLKQEKLRNKAIALNKPFVPVDYEEDEEQLVEVSIEIEKSIYYTSEEESGSSFDLSEEEAEVEFAQAQQ